jgi:transposase
MRDVARSVGVSSSTVLGCLTRATEAGLTWPLPDDLDDGQLERRLYPPPLSSSVTRTMPDLRSLHHELRRKGVTLQLLWHEYKSDHPDDGYQYSRFCDLYRSYAKTLDVVMRQEHKAGEKTFTDYSGDGIEIVDRHTGELREAPLFVATLGASSYTYVEAFESQELRWWVDGHIHAFEYFGGVTDLLIPDQTRTAVSKPCLYDPELNPTFNEMAVHYRTAVLPARPRKPRDKAKVETAVLVAQRWILAALRNHTFFNLAQANEAIAEKLEELNSKKFQKLDTTRRELYESLDRPALKPLPPTRYELAEWSKPKINIDYHVEVLRHLYSVPYQLYGEYVDARRTTHTVELFFKGRRVASHHRNDQPHRATTCLEHMPKAHQKHLEWTPSRILSWASKTGAKTEELCQRIMDGRQHPAQGYRPCLGLLRLGKKYGQDRLEAACGRALYIGSLSYKSVESILKNGLDRQPLLPGTNDNEPDPIEHENVRGPDYYN